MKLLWYTFFHSAIMCKKISPEKNPYSTAVYELTVGLGVLVGCIILKILYEIGLWEWALNNWPYDYGRIHSKNLIAPTGVLAISCCVAVYLVLRRYFLRQELIERILASFKGKENPKEVNRGSYSSALFLVMCLLTGVAFAAGQWVIFLALLAIWIWFEVNIRRRFF